MGAQVQLNQSDHVGPFPTAQKCMAVGTQETPAFPVTTASEISSKTIAIATHCHSLVF